MDIREFEQFIVKELEKITKKIILNNNNLNISARARAGAEISDFLENEFVEYTQNHKYLKNSESSPEGQTKNPWDARTFFTYESIVEEIWIDFKAFKITSADSNPDIGTPNKIIKFIKDGNFYLVYIHVYYQQKNDGIEFVKHEGSFTKIYFLKDISSTFRRNPKNQLQVNISEPTVYRTREEFIKILCNKLKESHQRQIEISRKYLTTIEKMEEDLIKINKISAKRITKNS